MKITQSGLSQMKISLGKKVKAAPLARTSSPGQIAWTKFLAECAAMEQSHAEVIAHFLAFTGMRIAEARTLLWENVKADLISFQRFSAGA